MEKIVTKAFLMGLSLFALAACGSSDPAANGDSVTIGDTRFSENQNKDSVTIENEKGHLTAREGAAAAATEFPDFAPQYPGSTVEGVIVSGGKGKRTKNLVTLTSTDSLEQVAAFYRAKFSEHGFTIGMNFLMDDSLMIEAEAGEKKAGILGGIVDGKTSLTLSFSEG